MGETVGVGLVVFADALGMGLFLVEALGEVEGRLPGEACGEANSVVVLGEGAGSLRWVRKRATTNIELPVSRSNPMVARTKTFL